MGRLGTLKPTVPARNSINPIKMVQSRKIAVKGSVDNLSFPSMLLESQISSQPLAKRLILNFFHQSFLSRDAYDRALGRDVINGRSKLTSQRQFASIRGLAQCIASVIVKMTVFAHSQTTNKLVNKAANDSARVSGQDRKIPPALGTNQIVRFGGFLPLTSSEKK